MTSPTANKVVLSRTYTLDFPADQTSAHPIISASRRHLARLWLTVEKNGQTSIAPSAPSPLANFAGGPITWQEPEPG